MSQPYPDPPISSPLMEGKTLMMAIIWWKWIQGFRVLVNRLSVGIDINGTFPLGPVTVGGAPGSITIQNGVVTNLTPGT